jgi:hypothetical protein
MQSEQHDGAHAIAWTGSDRSGTFGPRHNGRFAEAVRQTCTATITSNWKRPSIVISLFSRVPYLRALWSLAAAPLWPVPIRPTQS